MIEIKKPQLKPIGSIVGIGGKREAHAYLTRIFTAIGFQEDNEGVLAFAKYNGVIDNTKLKVTFSILKKTNYKGIDAEHFIRYRTFEGLRMNVAIPLNVNSRLVIAKKTTGKWLKRFTKISMKLKQFKLIDNNYLDKEVYSPDENYAQQIITDNEVKETISQLNQKQAKVLSWGIIQTPGKLAYGSTFADFSDFDEGTLLNRLNNITQLAHLFDTKIVSKSLELTKSEILARDNPKKSIYKGLLLILLFLLIGLSVIGLLFFITVKYGKAPVLILTVISYIIYKKI